MPVGDRHDDHLRKGTAPTQLAISTTPERRWNATAVAIQPNFCPECGLMISERALPEHLITAHDYLTLSGTLLPRPVALTCLWDRVFNTGDTQAHERLCLLLGNRPDEQGRIPYVAALEAELLRWLEITSSKPRRDAERLVRNLRKSQAARVYYWDLLAAEDPRIRQLGRELLLPEVGQILDDDQVPAAEVRRWLDKLCPVEDVWDKIRIGQRLPHFGAAKDPIKECLRQLQEERPVACPECGRAVPQYVIESHLRQAHRIYQFNGVARSLEETIDALLAALCCQRPELEDWETLESLARDEYGVNAESFLAQRLAQSLKASDDENRSEVISALAEIIAFSPAGSQIGELLAKAGEPAARPLVLTLTTRLQQPLSDSLVRAVRPLLVRKRAPQEAQFAAAVALLETTSKDAHSTQKVLNAFISRCGKTRALERLRQIEQQFGPMQAISDLCTRIENQIRLSCPRCGIELRRPGMTRHVWEEHGLLLDRRTVKRPWRLVKDWIKEYRRTGNAELLPRCRALGQYLDPEDGSQRVHRLLLAHHVDDVEARQILLAGARQRHASLCPHCYALVGVPDDTMPRPLNQSRGRLALNGYCVEVSEKGVRPHFLIDTPGERIYRGPEPKRWLSGRGATFLVAGPLVCTALLFAILFPYLGISPHAPVAVALVLAMFASVVVRLQGWSGPKPFDRAVDYAWSWLAPRLHFGDFSIEDSTFLAGLALTSINQGTRETRAVSLDRVLRLTENAVAGAACPLAHLAALKRLEASDLAAVEGDPIPPIAAALARCFDGSLPLLFAQQFLDNWEASWWTTGNVSRLRVLLCDSAFEAGLEVADLIAVGRNSPAIGGVLQVDNPNGLARLRLLWSLRPSRPWDRWSSAVTVYDLARDAASGGSLLEKHPDLLLIDQTSPPIYLCGQGIVFRGHLFTQPPGRIEMKARKDFERIDYEVVLGPQRFSWPSDPSDLVTRLERWFRFLFSDFLPQLSGVFSWQAPAGTKSLRARQAAPCPECQRQVVPIPGEVGALVHRRKKRKR